jgi:hypothetical protein
MPTRGAGKELPASEATGRFEAELRWQPVVEVPRRIETSEAPGWQGATTPGSPPRVFQRGGVAGGHSAGPDSAV